MKNNSQDEKKLEELIVHISEKCNDHALFGKILFFSDFFAFQASGKSITGTDYRKLPHGPAPRRMKPVLEKLETHPIARRKADLSIFAAEDIELVNDVVEQLQHMTAQEVSDMTHAQIGWRLAQLNETIPYCTAFVGTGSDPLTTADQVAGRALAEALQ